MLKRMKKNSNNKNNKSTKINAKQTKNNEEKIPNFEELPVPVYTRDEKKGTIKIPNTYNKGYFGNVKQLLFPPKY